MKYTIKDKFETYVNYKDSYFILLDFSNDYIIDGYISRGDEERGDVEIKTLYRIFVNGYTYKIIGELYLEDKDYILMDYDYEIFI